MYISVLISGQLTNICIIPIGGKDMKLLHKTKLRLKNRLGFTLIDMLLVIGILIILSMITINLHNVYQNKVKIPVATEQVNKYKNLP